MQVYTLTKCVNIIDKPKNILKSHKTPSSGTIKKPKKKNMKNNEKFLEIMKKLI